jgi:hypothetical protein
VNGCKRLCTSGIAFIFVIDGVTKRLSLFSFVVIKGICDEILDIVDCFDKRFVELLLSKQKYKQEL